MIKHDGQCRRGNAAHQYGSNILCLQTTKYVVSETGGAHRRCQGCGTYNPYRRRANSRNYHRQCQREFYSGEYLKISHADSASCLYGRGIDSQDTRYGIAEDGQEAVERKRNQRRHEADHSQQRYHQRQQRNTRNSLENPYDTQCGPLQCLHTRYYESERYTNYDPCGQRQNSQQQMGTEVARKQVKLLSPRGATHRPSPDVSSE